MTKDNDNFLEHTYHDSYIKGMERRHNKTTLIIDTDIHWYPGKPFTLLILVNADNVVRIKELVGGAKHTSMSIGKAIIERSDKSDKNFKLEVKFHSGTQLESHCYNFWTERVEEYKEYTNMIFK